MSETLRRYDAEFGHVSAQCIDQHRALSDQKATRPMRHIVLVALDVSLHVARRNQLDPMSERVQLTAQ